MTTNRISERTFRNSACFAVAQKSASPCKHQALRSRVRPVDPTMTDRRVLRVLIYDENPDTADEMARQVRRWGHTAMWASNTPTAIHMASARHPDVVLLNSETSLSEGCRVARRLRRSFEKKASLLIAFTERADDDSRQQYEAAGIDVLFVRPVETTVVETLLLLECVNVNRHRLPRIENEQFT